jgi:DNA-binding PadR family transcriptional regulator
VKVDQWTNISRASIYNTLKRLEAEGCVTVKTEKVGNMPERNVYTITEKGKQRLLEELRQNMLLPQDSGNTFALAMLFCFGMPAEEAIGILEKRIAILNNEIEKLKTDCSKAEKNKVYNWVIFSKAAIKHMELEIETAKEFIKLFGEVPDYYDKNVYELYRYMVQRYRK